MAFWYDNSCNPIDYDPDDYNHCPECGNETKKENDKCWCCDHKFEV